MKLPGIFRRICKDDEDLKRRRETSEAQLLQIADDLRNQAQVMQSGSRRLRTMARTMTLIREGLDDPSR